MCKHAWFLPSLYKELTWSVGRSKGELQTSPWSSKEKRKGGKEMRKERRKKKRKLEEERKKKEEEEGVLRSEQIWTEKNTKLHYKR